MEVMILDSTVSLSIFEAISAAVICWAMAGMVAASTMRVADLNNMMGVCGAMGLVIIA